MPDRGEYDIFFDDLSSDLKLSKWGDYKNNSWTKWMDKRIFRGDKKMEKGLYKQSYQSWLRFYFRAFRLDAPTEIKFESSKSVVKIYRDPLLIPSAGIEEWTGKKPLWSFSFQDKYILVPERSKLRYEFELGEWSNGVYQTFVERECIVNILGKSALVERVYLDKHRKDLDEITILTPTTGGLVLYVDNLDKKYAFQYRYDTFLIKTEDKFDVNSLLRKNTKLYRLLFSKNKEKYGIKDTERIHLN